MEKPRTKKFLLFFLLYATLFITGLCAYKVFGSKIVESLNNLDLVDNRINAVYFLTDFVTKNYLKILITFSWFGSLVIFIICYYWKRVTLISGNFSRRKMLEFFGFLSATIIGAFILLWAAFHNRFPLVFHDDTANYIRDLFSRSRPPGYGFFVQFLGLALYPSLWTVVFIQALLTSFIIIRVSSVFLSETKKKIFIALGILSLLVFVTDISKYTSWVMADISTSWLFLGGLLFLTSYKWYDRYLATALITMSIFNHTSHILIGVICGIILFSFSFAFRNKFLMQWKNCQKLFLVIFLSVVSVMFLNFAIGGGFNLSYQGGANFLLAKIGSSTKAVSQVLENYHSKKKWQLYDYRDMFDNPQISSDYLLWGNNSPLSKVIMWKDQSEQGEIVKYAVKDFWPEIINMFCQDSLRQFLCFNSKDGLERHEYKKCEIYKSIKMKIPGDLNSFLQARQQQGLGVKVRIFSLNQQIVYYVILISAFLFSVLFFLKQKYKPLLLLLSAFVFICLNAIICGSFSTVHGRYQGRVIWLIAYCLFLSIFYFIQKK